MSKTNQNTVARVADEVLRRFMQGDDSALKEKASRECYNRYGDCLRKYVSRRCDNIEHYEDIAQDAFIKAYRNVSRECIPQNRPLVACYVIVVLVVICYIHIAVRFMSRNNQRLTYACEALRWKKLAIWRHLLSKQAKNPFIKMTRVPSLG